MQKIKKGGNFLNLVGVKLKQIRKQKKLTQSELADGIVNRSYISQIEKGSVQPSFKLLKRLSEKLECRVNDLLEDSESTAITLDLNKILSAIEYLVLNEDFTIAEKEMMEIRSSLDKLNNSELALYYFCRGKLEEHRKNIGGAISSYKKSCELFTKVSMLDERFRSFNHLINLYLKINEIHKAFVYLDQAYDELVFFKINGVEKISLLINLGIAHAKLEEYYSAIRFLKHAIRTSNKTGIYFQTGKAYMVLGLCERRTKNYKEASNYYEKALYYFMGNEDHINIAGTYTNLGILKRFEEDYNNSIKYLNKAKDLYSFLNDVKGMLNTLYEMAITYLELKEYSKVHLCYLKFGKIYDDNADNPEYKELSIKFSIKVGDTYIEEKKYQQAIKQYKDSIPDNLNPDMRKQVYVKLSKVYMIIEDNNSLLKCWENFIKDADADITSGQNA